MTNEQSRAVSFANSYFTLVDGLASGLEDYLVGDVILDWFGRTVRGKRNVNTFMKAHKVNSRHIFNNIVPTETIGYRKYNLNRKTINLLTNAQQNMNENVKHSLNSLQTTDNEGNFLNEEEGVSYELGNNDLNGLGKREITPTIVNEIEWNIEKMKKLKFENEIMERKVEKNFAQADGPGEIEVQTKRVKFVEATGEMHLWRNCRFALAS
ncbi:uncharacterized protein LOC117168883 isoform X2 [Belonocnema kinseyi]|uniref:uncharacterized protein LOC117168883 isoform X2 n=1 Tax=Belonocnema kinseyi TaxID=2817044 RepID=UPI00143DBA7A|nr:uncharacterized protein LOC117168883 isoform X2 [Belonocnema kinseyi]